ncbi:class I SAM-dependent methyltransferase [Pelagibacterium xiamenense]|uniref:class I SAM-dependent methyltransferase n=1 Tax=Pelagibacterium xiamenense TaxID=2901140 RepID=UPI001E64E6DB|nr:class I SAM-dependent methyltransferase [Pelagibacterium xiamenense]MCD7060621.1 class I SAM-dependent methyltransferase [Pelagibacterium xiamenense]
MVSDIEQHLALLNRLLPVRAGALAVDVGCGDGSATRALASAGWRALGLETSPALVERARRSGPPVAGASFTTGYGEALPASAGGAALVLYLFSFHHVPESVRGDAIEQARQHLRPDGRLHVVDPLPDGPMSEVVLPVEDERNTRRHAHQLLAGLDGKGWRLLSRQSYVLGRVIADFQTIEDDLLRGNPASSDRVAEMRSEMEQRFTRLGVTVQGGRRLDQPCVAYHFAPA